MTTPPSREEYETLKSRVEVLATRLHDLANHMARNDVNIITIKDTVERLEEALSPSDSASKLVTRADVKLLVSIMIAMAMAAFALGVWLAKVK